MVASAAPKSRNIAAYQPILKKESSCLNSESQKGVADVKDYFIIYNQNIQGLKNKLNELTITLPKTKPHVISEHHLHNSFLNLYHIPSYRLGANYCRTALKCGGTCIFVHEDVHFTNIDLSKHCMEKNLEISALKVTFRKKFLIILCLYRAPSGDFEYFIDHLEEILQSLHNPKTHISLRRL